MADSSKKAQTRLGRIVFLALGMASLFAAIWGGLTRLPLNLPLPADNANWLTFHGPLMVCGFLGTVIGLERAVGLGNRWTYLAPLLTGGGAAMLLAGQMGSPPLLMITVGSMVFTAVSLRIIQLQRAPHTFLMGMAALAWLTGNVLWFLGYPIDRVLPWYIAFLCLVIVGERLDLSRFQRTAVWALPALFVVLAIFGIGVVGSTIRHEAGLRLMGAGLILTALWLGRFDIARRNLRQPALPRFMAISLLCGYVWLAVSGVVFMVFAPSQSGLLYDAALHSFFLGFVFSMIFGHAPIIFPVVLELRPGIMRNRFYVHLALLHGSLLLRFVSDLIGWGEGRQMGGILNAIAIVVFLINTVTSMIGNKKQS